jgi:hypothetical protein
MDMRKRVAVQLAVLVALFFIVPLLASLFARVFLAVTPHLRLQPRWFILLGRTVDFSAYAIGGAASALASWLLLRRVWDGVIASAAFAILTCVLGGLLFPILWHDTNHYVQSLCTILAAGTVALVLARASGARGKVTSGDCLTPRDEL